MAALTLQEKKERAEQKVAAREEARTKRSDGRRKAGAFNGTDGKLKVNQEIPGYHLYIFNDTVGRIQTALDSGYEFVTPDEVGGVGENVVSRNTDIGDKVRFLVGQVDGEPLYAYLMKIKEEWWEEDQASLQNKNNQTDTAIRNGTITKGDKFYDGGIKMEN